jgi:glycosyltransferase involved in cell wall biosynthesis
VISRHGRDEILGILGVRECPKLLVMHMGTGVPERPADGPPERVKVFRIACIANLVEKKGHRYLIEACRLLRERGCRFVCHIVGDGPLRGELEALARTYGLRDVVHFLGPFPHDRVMKMFREHEIDLMALPSIIDSSGELEGIPVALMEALAYGIPAISTETGGIPELLGDGAGALVKPADAQALTDAIQRIMEDSEYRATLIETGYARVSADFNIQTVADRLVELMESPCGGEWADGAVER